MVSTPCCNKRSHWDCMSKYLVEQENKKAGGRVKCKYCDTKINLLYFYKDYETMNFLGYPKPSTKKQANTRRRRLEINRKLHLDELATEDEVKQFENDIEELKNRLGEKIIILDPVTKPTTLRKQPRNRLPKEPTRRSERIGYDIPKYADPVWLNTRSFGMKRKPIVSEEEKILNKRIRTHNVAEKEIRDFEFQMKMDYIEYIDIDERNVEDRLPVCSRGVKEKHWVGYTYDGKEKNSP